MEKARSGIIVFSHPVGTFGNGIVVTLLYKMIQADKKSGLYLYQGRSRNDSYRKTQEIWG